MREYAESKDWVGETNANDDSHYEEGDIMTHNSWMYQLPSKINPFSLDK